MKKFLLLTTFIVAMCANASANVSNFDKGLPRSPKVEKLFKRMYEDWKFYNVCKEIIEVHKDFPQFREVLPKRLLRKADLGFYSLQEGIEIILIWLDDYDCYDILIEWPTVDQFFEMYEKH